MKIKLFIVDKESKSIYIDKRGNLPFKQLYATGDEFKEQLTMFCNKWRASLMCNTMKGEPVFACLVNNVIKDSPLPLSVLKKLVKNTYYSYEVFYAFKMYAIMGYLSSLEQAYIASKNETEASFTRSIIGYIHPLMTGENVGE